MRPKRTQLSRNHRAAPPGLMVPAGPDILTEAQKVREYLEKKQQRSGIRLVPDEIWQPFVEAIDEKP